MENKYAKQVIVIRKDLNMRKGKMCAQAAHASMKVLLDRMSCMSVSHLRTWATTLWEGEPMHDWLTGKFTKVVVSVDSEEELLELREKALKACICSALITDAGKTEFHGEPTNTALAVGPGWADEVDKITGHLKLL